MVDGAVPTPTVQGPTPALPRYDLACGQSKREGFLGVDRVACEGVDFTCDLFSTPWVFQDVKTGRFFKPEDASVEELHCSHFVEHIPMGENAKGVDHLCAFMNEVWRVLIPSGKATIICPWWNSVRAWQDPTHRRAISDVTFMYFRKEFRALNKLDHYPIVTDFDISFTYNVDGVVMNRAEDAKAFMVKHYANAVHDVNATLVKR